MASGDVLFVSEYLDFPSYQAINDALAAVDVGAFHDDAVLHLGVGDGGVVSDACVGTDEGVWSDLAAVAYDHGSPDDGMAMDYGSLSYPDAVGYGCVFFLFLVWFAYIYMWFEWKSCRGDGGWMSVFLRGWRGMLILFL